MTAVDLLPKLRDMGARLEIDQEGLVVRAPKGVLTPELREALRRHKGELLALLRQMHSPPPTDGELQEIAARVCREGYVLLYSTVLQDLVAFYHTEADRRKIPPGFAPYSDRELRELFGEGKPPLSSDQLRLIHAAKKEGAQVVSRTERAKQDDPRAACGEGLPTRPPGL